MTTDDASGKTPEAEIERIRELIATQGSRGARESHQPNRGRPARPRNSASLIVIDGHRDEPRVLMGRRNRSLKFMPGVFVFPGGAVDRSDGMIPACDEMPEATAKKIMRNMSGRPTERKARAFGMAAVRELAEETGILVGKADSPGPDHIDWLPFAQKRISPSLTGLRLLARAITPTDMPRRFDTWFFIVDKRAIAHVPEGGFQSSGELEELQWLTPKEAIVKNTREITRVMLVELMNRLKEDPDLDPAYTAPTFRTIRNRFQKSHM